jgi:hypothetical protein
LRKGGIFMAFGLDYVSGPPVAALKAAGVSFVCRYLSEVNPLTQVKLLTPGEAKTLSAAGISIVSNYEWYANRALEGFSSGAADARIALSQHTVCGGPSNRPVYFSVDVDCSGDQVATYFKGVASVLGLSRTGAYGSFRVLKYLFDAGLIQWGWQTYAWSYGAWEPRAHIQQYQNGMTVGGASVDYDRSIKSDFGQWRIGGIPVTQTIPTSWHLSPDGKTLYCPNHKAGGPDIPIVDPIKAYILANPWPSANVALQAQTHMTAMELSNPALGSGIVQTFRYARLEVPDSGAQAGHVIFGWLGVELEYLYAESISAATQMGALEGQVRTFENQVAGLQQEVAALQAQVAGLQAELTNQPGGLDPTLVMNRLQALELLFKQVDQAATQGMTLAVEPIQ